MNPEPETLTTEEPAQLTLLETSALATLGPKKTRPHDKIARLPKVLRDQINAMLDDGIAYHRIIARLQQSTDPPLPYPILEMDISRWKDGGYQRHLAQQERFEYVTQYREAAQEMVSADTTTLAEGALQIIASQYYDILTHFSPALLRQKLEEDPLKYTRFASIFARLTREIVHLKKHREQSAKAASVQPKQPAQNPPSTANDDKYWLDRADDLFGFKSAERLKREAAPARGAHDPDPALPSHLVPDPDPASPSPGAQNPDPAIPAVPQIQNPKSKIENTPERRPSNAISSAIQNQNSKTEAPEPIKNQKSKIQPRNTRRPPSSPSTPSQKDEVSLPPEQNPPPNNDLAHPESSIEYPASSIGHAEIFSPIENPKSEIENAPASSPSPPLEERVGERRPSVPNLDLSPGPEAVPEIQNSPETEERGPSPPGPDLNAPAETVSKIENPEVCHFCRSVLPPLLPDGQRPFNHCQRCGTALHATQNRHLYCPACASDLRCIIIGDRRLLSTCPCCEAPLPPWPPPT